MPVTNDPDDYWGKAVTLLTGYPMPSRKTLFDKLKSKEGIPLFRMDIQSMDVRAVAPEDFTAISGWNTHDGEDYDLAFYTAGGNGSHDGGVQMHRARIVFIGIPSIDGKGHLLDTGETWEAGAFTGKYGDEWDLGPLSQYLGGPKGALEALLGGTTRDVSFAGLDVADADAVDLTSFERTAQAFDRATQFFIDHAKTLEGWENSIGTEQSSWRGQAAGVFWHLIHQLHKNYDSYVDQLGGTDYQPKNQMQSGYRPKSLFGDSLAGAQQNLITQAKALQDAWNTWSQTYFYDPHRMLLTALDDLTKWVIANNVPYIQSHSNMSYATTYSTTDQFQENSPYGPLNDINTFKKLAEQVVTDWNTHVDNDLGTPAQTVISTLGNDWSEAGGDFDEPLKTKDTTTLSESYQTEAAEIAQEQADQNAKDLNDSLNGLGDGLDGLGDDLNGLGDGLGDSLDGLGDNLNGLGDGLGDSLNGLGDNLNGLGDGLGDGLNGLGDNLTSALNGSGGPGGLGLDGLGGPGPTDLNGGGPPVGLSTLSTALNGPGGLLGGGPGGDQGGGPGMPVPLNNPFAPNGTPTTSDLNNVGNLNGGPDPAKGVDSLTGPGGGITKLNADGSLVTTFPDGSKSVVNPADHTVTTTTPGGDSTTSPLNSGDSFKNSDGSVTTLNPDGTLTTKSPDGTSTTINPDTGAATITNPDGSTVTSNLNPQVGSFSTPGGGTSHLNPDGSLTTTLPDGTQETINPANHTVTTTTPDGHSTTSPLNTGDAFQNPDGSTTTLNPDGTLTTKFPDGTVDTLNPATGDLNTTAPDGTQHTSNLNPPGIDGIPGPKDLTSNLNNPPSDLNNPPSDLNNPPGDLGLDHQLPDSLNLNSLGNNGNLPGGLPDSTSLLNSGGVGGGGTGSGLNGFADPSLDDFEDYDSTPYGGGPLGGGSNDFSALLGGQQAQQGPAGTPLNPMSGGGGGGGMGGGGGGMGGAGGGSNNNERVRNVLGGETGGASLRRTSSRGVPEEGEDVVLSRNGRPTTSSGSPMYPGGGGGHGSGQGDQSTSSGDRERAGWVPEDDDVWGTEGEGGAPAVIG